MSVFHLNEESRENQERAKEKVAEDAAIFHVKYGSAEQTKSLRHEADQKVDEEEGSEAKDFERLTSHEVRD